MKRWRNGWPWTFVRVISGRWLIVNDAWFPAGLFCRFFGHGREIYYDGYWCERCGAER